LLPAVQVTLLLLLRLLKLAVLPALMIGLTQFTQAQHIRASVCANLAGLFIVAAVQVTLLLLLKLAVLPALMIALTQLMGMRNTYGLSLVLLSSCPLAPLAFLVCQQYGVGAELATSVTIQGVLLMLPQMMAIIKISQVQCAAWLMAWNLAWATSLAGNG
jgi:predicted permease